MLKKLFIILFIALMFGCNTFKKDTKTAIIGKWTLVEPIEIISSFKITKLDVEFTENGNSFREATFEFVGKSLNDKAHGKYEVDGKRVIWDTGAVFTLSDDGFLISEQSFPSLPNKVFTAKLKRL